MAYIVTINLNRQIELNAPWDRDYLAARLAPDRLKLQLIVDSQGWDADSLQWRAAAIPPGFRMRHPRQGLLNRLGERLRLP